MKKFIVDTGEKKYKVEANDAEHAVKLIKKINDAEHTVKLIKKIDDERTATVQRVKMTKEKGKYWIVEYESSPYVYEAEYFKTKNEALSWAKSKGFKITRVDDDSTFIARDEASQLQTVNALIEDEKAAVEAYNVAIENLRGKIPEESLQAIIAIRDDENRHIENLQAVVNGTVTEKNLEDSVKDDAYVIEVYWRAAKRFGEKRQWLSGKFATTEINRADKFTSEQQAKEVIRLQNIGNMARVVRMSSIRDNENRHIENLQAVVNGTVTEKNLEDSMMNDNDDIGLSLERSLRTLGWNYTVGKIYDYIRTHAVYGVPNNPDAINRVKEVLSKNGATKFKVVKNDYGFAIVCFKAKDSINGTVTEKNLEDSMINDNIEECYKSLAEAKDIISTIYKNHAKEQDEEYMLKKLKEASSAIARAIRQYKAWI